MAAIPAWGAFIQSSSFLSAATTTGGTLALAQTLFPGNTYVMFVTYTGAAQVLTIKDSLQNIWKAVGPAISNGTSVTQWFYSTAVNAGVDVLQFSVPVTRTNFLVWVGEYMGESRFESQVGATASSTGPATVSITPQQSNELVVCGFVSVAAQLNVLSAATSRFLSGTTYSVADQGSTLAGNGAAISPSYTLSLTSVWSAHAATFVMNPNTTGGVYGGGLTI